MAGWKKYQVRIEWTGNTGFGTSAYGAYERSHTIQVDGKPILYGSSDPAFRGEATKYNPEELLVASLSSCHMLWYLHLCAEAGITVLDYKDEALGVMVEHVDGSGCFKEAVLRPKVTLADRNLLDLAINLHKVAHKKCFIANSVNFPVLHHPEISVS